MIDEIDELSKARADLARLQADFDELQDQLDGIHDDIAEHLPHYALSEDDSDEANPSETVEYAGDELRAVTAERDRIMVELGETITQRDELRAEVERLRAELRAEVERLRAELGHLRKHVQHNDEDYKTMKAVLRSVHSVYQEALGAPIETVERLRAEILDVAQRATNAVTAEHLRAEELRAEVERLRQRIDFGLGQAANTITQNERAACVRWLRGNGHDLAADEIERGDHRKDKR